MYLNNPPPVAGVHLVNHPYQFRCVKVELLWCKDQVIGKLRVPKQFLNARNDVAEIQTKFLAIDSNNFMLERWAPRQLIDKRVELSCSPKGESKCVYYLVRLVLVLFLIE
jgi:hypothetical protein